MPDPNDAPRPAAAEEPDIELDEAQEDRQFAEELAQEAEPAWTPDWWCTEHGDAGDEGEECRDCAEERAYWRTPEVEAVPEVETYPENVPEWEPVAHPEMARQARELVERYAEAPEYVLERTVQL